MCSEGASAPRRVLTLPNDDDLYAGDCVLWVANQECTNWAVQAQFHYTKARDTVGQLAALFTKAVKGVVTADRSLLNGPTLGSVTVLFSDRYNVKVNVKSILYNLNGSVHITVHVLGTSTYCENLTDALKRLLETGSACKLSWMSLAQSIPSSPSQVQYKPQHSATRYILPNRPQREVFMVPLCHCMRRRTADDLLDELEKTDCVHSLTAALHEFAARHLHLASSIDDGLSAIPNGFALPHHEVRVIEHCIQVNPRLTTWCAEPNCPFLWRDDSHPQLDSA